jgi:hypothetical protein
LAVVRAGVDAAADRDFILALTLRLGGTVAISMPNSTFRAFLCSIREKVAKKDIRKYISSYGNLSEGHSAGPSRTIPGESRCNPVYGLSK